MAPDEVLPHLAARRLLTREKVGEVEKKINRLQKITTILEAIHDQRIVGRLPTFCAALASTAGQEHAAETLTHCECVITIIMNKKVVYIRTMHKLSFGHKFNFGRLCLQRLVDGVWETTVVYENLQGVHELVLGVWLRSQNSLRYKSVLRYKFTPHSLDALVT